jgi:hypothetical protein
MAGLLRKKGRPDRGHRLVLVVGGMKEAFLLSRKVCIASLPFTRSQRSLIHRPAGPVNTVNPQGIDRSQSKSTNDGTLRHAVNGVNGVNA